MLETYEILELERRWRAYDKKRKEFKFSDKKNYIYAISAILAISVSVSSLTFYLLKDSLVNNVSSTTISKDVKKSNKEIKNTLSNNLGFSFQTNAAISYEISNVLCSAPCQNGILSSLTLLAFSQCGQFSFSYG